jgi:hypothetical protein
MEGIEKLRIGIDGDGVVLAVKVVPGSSRDKVVGVLGDALKIATSAPAEKGKANAAAREILAGALGINGQYVQLIGGAASPRKKFRVAGLTAARIARKLAELS